MARDGSRGPPREGQRRAAHLGRPMKLPLMISVKKPNMVPEEALAGCRGGPRV